METTPAPGADHRPAGAAARAWLALLALLPAGMQGDRLEAAFDVSPPRPVGKGTAVVLRPEEPKGERAGSEPGDLLIHFHGAVETIRQALERAGTEATVVVVNQPGLSAAYAAPFREDPQLFASLLAAARSPQPDGIDPPALRWRRVTLSCFSAGYGAVREILKDPAAVDSVATVVAADSIYAGIDPAAEATGSRGVDARDMEAFVAFAERAVRGEKVFVITHSAQPTPYASTTETADHLLRSVGVGRTMVTPARGEEFAQVSEAGRRGFAVMGFSGASGSAHLFHLRSIERWWAVAQRLETARGREDRR